MIGTLLPPLLFLLCAAYNAQTRFLVWRGADNRLFRYTGLAASLVLAVAATLWKASVLDDIFTILLQFGSCPTGTHGIVASTRLLLPTCYAHTHYFTHFMLSSVTHSVVPFVKYPHFPLKKVASVQNSTATTRRPQLHHAGAHTDFMCSSASPVCVESARAGSSVPPSAHPPRALYSSVNIVATPFASAFFNPFYSGARVLALISPDIAYLVHWEQFGTSPPPKASMALLTLVFRFCFIVFDHMSHATPHTAGIYRHVLEVVFELQLLHLIEQQHFVVGHTHSHGASPHDSIADPSPPGCTFGIIVIPLFPCLCM